MTIDKYLSARLVDYAKDALNELEWQKVRSFADAALRLDPDNGWAEKYKQAAQTALSDNARGVMLHEEIEAVLEESAPEPLTYAEISRRVNERGRYRRSDEKDVPSGQIRARVAKYEKKQDSAFERTGRGLVALKRQ